MATKKRKKKDEGFSQTLDKNTECSITVTGSYDNFEALEAEFDRFNKIYPNVQLSYVKLDYMMPEKDGIEVLGKMRGLKDTPNDATPIICLTANAISGMSEMYINAGFDDYMTKPIDPDKLEGMLLKYLPKEKVVLASDEDLRDDNDCDMIPGYIMNIDAIDVETEIKYCGSSEAYLITLKKVLETAGKNADDIETFWTSKDIKNITIKVHALKSTSRIIGAMELGVFAEKLEKAGDEGNIKMLEEELPELISEYRKLAKDLEPLKEQEKSKGDDERPVIFLTANEDSDSEAKGLLHDVGKIGVPDTIINKPGRLTDEEYMEIKKHPVKGAEILATITEMPKLVTGARWHHA